MSLVNIIFYSLIIVLVIIGLLTSIYLFVMMALRRSIVMHHKTNYLVASNSYIAYILCSPFLLEMAIRSLYGQFRPESNFNGWVCRLKSYGLYIHGCMYFLSFLLQSIYRFCRLVHPKRVILRSFRLYIILSVGLWFLAAALLLPSYFLDAIDYIPHDYHCQYLPTDLRGSLLGLSFLFLFAFILTLICYFYTMYHVRTQTTTLATISQKRHMHRDLVLFSRLFFLFIFITIVTLPHLIIPIIYNITDYLPAWVTSFEWLLTAFSLTTASIIQLFANPHLKRICIQAKHGKPTRRLSITRPEWF